MQAIDVQKVVPQNSVENAEVQPVPAHEQVSVEDEFNSISQQIRDITAFGDCV